MKAVAFVHGNAQQVAEVAPAKRKKLFKLARQLLVVITQNLDREEVDGKERWVMAQKVAPERIASLTDPEARHGRKSSSQTYTGFKIHVLGDCMSGLIASLTVTKGNQHDATVTPRLVGRAKDLVDTFDTLLADTAYGGAELRHELAHVAGVRVVAPPPPVSASGERFVRMLDLALGAPDAVHGLYIVAPDSREAEVRAQLARPAFRQIGDLKVRYLPYGELELNRSAMARFGRGLAPLEAIARVL